MIEVLTDMIVWTALGGSLLIIAIVVMKAVVSLAARASVVEKGHPTVVSKERECRYCGMILGQEHKCSNCGAVERDDSCQ